MRTQMDARFAHLYSRLLLALALLLCGVALVVNLLVIFGVGRGFDQSLFLAGLFLSLTISLIAATIPFLQKSMFLRSQSAPLKRMRKLFYLALAYGIFAIMLGVGAALRYQAPVLRSWVLSAMLLSFSAMSVGVLYVAIYAERVSETELAHRAKESFLMAAVAMVTFWLLGLL